MRRFIFAVVVLGFLGSTVDAWGVKASWYTDKKINGNYLIEEDELEGQLERPSHLRIGTTGRYYLYGLIDGLNQSEPLAKLLKENFPHCTRLEVSEEVIIYYQKNPSQRHRPVIDVLMNGVK